MKNRERVLEFIRSESTGLTDLEIHQLTGIQPIQQVNQICRRLADQGLIERRPGPQGKIINLPANSRLDIKQITCILSDPTRCEPASDFPQDPNRAGKPGLYSWWADEEAQEMFFKATGFRVEQPCYAGQAGAGQSGLILTKRIRFHISGTVENSTLRRTISALLFQFHGKISSRGEVTEWIKRHLKVSIAPVEDRDSLEFLEKEVLSELDPPFNLKSVSNSSLRKRLKVLRKEFKQALP